MDRDVIENLERYTIRLKLLSQDAYRDMLHWIDENVPMEHHPMVSAEDHGQYDWRITVTFHSGDEHHASLFKLFWQK